MSPEFARHSSSGGVEYTLTLNIGEICRGDGSPTYNLFRPDVSGAFPGLANTSGPVGYRAIDTTGLAEGLHTISRTVTDTRPATSGIGSRYFTVANSADASQPGAGECLERCGIE